MSVLGGSEMTGARDPFEVLGLPPNASDDEVRKRYRFLIRRFHPDTVASDGPEMIEYATRMSAEINEAYRVLTDPGLRAAFDATSHPPDLRITSIVDSIDIDEAEPALVRFRVENHGGAVPPDTTLAIRCNKGGWSITLRKMQSVSNVEVFPVDVEIEISTEGLTRDAWLHGEIEVELVAAE